MFKRFSFYMVLGCLFISAALGESNPLMGQPLANGVVKGFPTPTKHPDLSIFQGKLFVVEILGNPAALNIDHVFNGTAFVLAQYAGKDPLSEGLQTLIRDPKELTFIRDYGFFKSWSHPKDIAVSDLANAHQFALVNYNAEGYLVARSAIAYGIAYIQFDSDKNTIQLMDAHRRMLLSGQLLNLS